MAVARRLVRRPIARFAAAVAAGLTACAAAPPVLPPPAAVMAPAAAADPSFDWRNLMTAPFASTLKELPFTVHEVLQFGDEPGARAEEECFRRDVDPPRLVGRELDDYLLCFRRDRLERIEADLRLETAGAEAVFARYCDGWLKNSTLVARTEANCRGEADGIAFDARLDEDRSQSTTALSLNLSGDADAVP